MNEDMLVLKLWVDQWADTQAEVDEPDACDMEERKVILAARRVMDAVPVEGNHVAYLRWNGRSWSTCDQDADGAFPVYRAPAEISCDC
jgi:hypothetical protein